MVRDFFWTRFIHPSQKTTGMPIYGENDFLMHETTVCKVKDLGLIDYGRTYVLQKQYVENLLKGGSQVLLLCEHPSVLTLGRLADEKNILISEEELVKRGLKIHHIDRGGDITLHAPGQLVVYPILDLARLGKDLRCYLYQLEQVAIDLFGNFDIVANRLSGQTGVWFGKQKIVSIGIGVRRWISFHGLAINVSTDLKLFSMINPCGLNIEMISMSEIKRQMIDMAEVKKEMINCFCKKFQLHCSKD